jgi:hypothetical protein
MKRRQRQEEWDWPPQERRYRPHIMLDVTPTRPSMWVKLGNVSWRIVVLMAQLVIGVVGVVALASGIWLILAVLMGH